jgi:hypothetical protein
MHRLIAGSLSLCLFVGTSAVLLAGCRQTASLSQQEVVVAFTPEATQADHARVWALCQHVDGTTPEPMVTKSKYPATLAFNVRYRVDHATNLQLQELFNCLKQDPTVVGYSTTGDGDQ